MRVGDWHTYHLVDKMVITLIVGKNNPWHKVTAQLLKILSVVIWERNALEVQGFGYLIESRKQCFQRQWS